MQVRIAGEAARRQAHTLGRCDSHTWLGSLLRRIVIGSPGVIISTGHTISVSRLSRTCGLPRRHRTTLWDLPDGHRLPQTSNLCAEAMILSRVWELGVSRLAPAPLCTALSFWNIRKHYPNRIMQWGTQALPTIANPSSRRRVRLKALLPSPSVGRLTPIRSVTRCAVHDARSLYRHSWPLAVCRARVATDPVAPHPHAQALAQCVVPSSTLSAADKGVTLASAYSACGACNRRREPKVCCVTRPSDH
jgi:hypothetical protein